MRRFRDMEAMLGRYKISPHRDDVKLALLSALGFIAFIYNLDTDRFDCVGFSTTGYMRYLSSGSMWAFEITEYLDYSKEGFIEQLG